jgi:hypothetical protein
MSRLFTKKKDSITNHKDALIAEEQESSKITTIEALEDNFKVRDVAKLL